MTQGPNWKLIRNTQKYVDEINNHMESACLDFEEVEIIRRIAADGSISTVDQPVFSDY